MVEERFFHTLSLGARCFRMFKKVVFSKRYLTVICEKKKGEQEIEHACEYNSLEDAYFIREFEKF